MTNVSIRPGGSPVAAENFVAVDNVTIQGSGTTRDPLHVVASAPPDPQLVSATAIQHGAIDGTTALSLCGSLVNAGLVELVRSG